MVVVFYRNKYKQIVYSSYIDNIIEGRNVNVHFIK